MQSPCIPSPQRVRYVGAARIDDIFVRLLPNVRFFQQSLTCKDVCPSPEERLSPHSAGNEGSSSLSFLATGQCTEADPQGNCVTPSKVAECRDLIASKVHRWKPRWTQVPLRSNCVVANGREDRQRKLERNRFSAETVGRFGSDPPIVCIVLSATQCRAAAVINLRRTLI